MRGIKCQGDVLVDVLWWGPRTLLIEGKLKISLLLTWREHFPSINMTWATDMRGLCTVQKLGFSDSICWKSGKEESEMTLRKMYKVVRGLAMRIWERTGRGDTFTLNFTSSLLLLKKNKQWVSKYSFLLSGNLRIIFFKLMVFCIANWIEVILRHLSRGAWLERKDLRSHRNYSQRSDIVKN